MGILNDNWIQKWIRDPDRQLSDLRTYMQTKQEETRMSQPTNPYQKYWFDPTAAQTKMAGSLQAPAPIALVVRDERVPTPLPSKSLDLIPSGTVFQGRIGSVTGTFKKNQNTVCQLDGHSVWMTPNTYMTGGYNGPCHNYQPVHGRVIIERNA